LPDAGQIIRWQRPKLGSKSQLAGLYRPLRRIAGGDNGRAVL